MITVKKKKNLFYLFHAFIIYFWYLLNAFHMCEFNILPHKKFEKNFKQSIYCVKNVCICCRGSDAWQWCVCVCACVCVCVCLYTTVMHNFLYNK